ncbi:class I SAM-dependent methyltransferase [Pseudonocardia spirodelae]|uniref:Methyltransferase domain-containing protein n=1 Tax=Pseudonocardia spirodelae TaxID=3133431 RepID=A0ABU8T5R3_9PSEU
MQANATQRRSWDGPTGDVWTRWAERFEAGVAGYTGAFADAAALAPGERVLDVGCGPGGTALAAAAATGPDGHVLGVDLSSSLVARARERAAAAGARTAEFAVADAQVDDLGVHDVVLSRNGVMFFDDPAAAFANLHRALRPGGRVALQVWRSWAEQEWLQVVLGALDVPPPPDGAPGPVGLGDPQRCRALLTGAGFTGVAVTGVRRPMWFGADVDDATAFLLDQHAARLAELPAARRDAAAGRLRTALAAHAGPDGVVAGSAAWLLTADRP